MIRIILSLILTISLMACGGPKGDQGPAGRDGADGSTGPAGAVGSAGSIGPSGVEGQDGRDGQDGTTVEVIDPCGNETGHDEIILAMETGGEVVFVAYFETGEDRHLTPLQEDTVYQTTDGTECQFVIENGMYVEL